MKDKLRTLLEALVLTIALNLVSSGVYDAVKDLYKEWVTVAVTTARAIDHKYPAVLATMRTGE